MSQTVTVGYAARLPNAGDAGAAWHILRDGQCTVSQIPDDRWSSLKFLDPTGTLAGHSHTRAAGVLDDPWGFDPAAFGISPREAAQMDPQQRLLLELASEAFDHAGINPLRLDRDRTGVFIGASAADHSTIGLQDPTLIESHYMLGNTLSILANRISYQWDLHGPSMTVDTACSSGLVAFDLARKAIEAGEIDTAIVGGVSLLLSPVAFIGFSNAGMLSHRGRCAAFGAGGDGYVRAEGAVVFILSRAETARAAGLRLRSVVAGSGVNTAGYTRGITIPSQSRQADLIREVMASSGIDPDDLAFAEAHGTGTPVGDPREAGALGETYGRLRKTPLPIGSAKSNFGHLEPASGLVGLLKAQLALEHHYMPATLFADTPNPDIDFTALNLEPMTEARPMPPHARPWAVSVNSFGFGGANAHVVIREPDPEDRIAEEDDTTLPPALMMTGQSETALTAVAQDWQWLLSGAEPDDAQLATLIANANHNLARRAHRLCLAAGSREALRDQIDRWIAGDHPDRAGFRARGDDLPVAFVFSGNGALWDGMARQNYMKDAAFRKSFTEIAALVAQDGGPDLVTLLMTPQDEEAMRPAGIAQPLHFAIQVALVDSLAAAGLRPAAVMGHSLGEVAASVIAGRISRKEGVHIILSRSAAFAPLENTGGMAALSGGRQAVADLIAGLGLPIDISAENAPASVTVSGAQADLAALVKAARKARIAGKVLPVAYPYHGRAVGALESRMRADLAGLAPQAGTIPFYSGSLGCRADTVPSDADYWWSNARNAVEFRAAAAAMVADGYRIFLEISPRSVLRGYLGEIIAQSGEPAVVIDGLDRSHPELRLASDIARRVLAVGGAVEEERVLGPRRPMRSTPPRPAFERQPFRLATTHGPDIFGRAPAHPLLGARSEAEGTIWRNDLSLALMPWLGDHRVGGRVLLPATGMAEIFLAAATDLAREGEAAPGPCEIADLDIFHAVVIPEEGAAQIRVIHDAAARRLTLETGGDGQWQAVATARLFSAASAADLIPEVMRNAAAGDPAPLPGLYDGLRRAGLEYGPAFARLAGLSQTPNGALAELSPALVPGDFLLDPTAFDAALHAVAALPAFAAMAAGNGPMVPGRMGRLRWFDKAPVTRARLHLRSFGPESACLDLALFGDDGGLVALIEEIRLRRMPMTHGAEALYWDEVLLPLAGESRIALADPLSRFGAGEEAASNADVLRAAIAARLAWDIAGSDDTTIPEARRQLSRAWLNEAGYLSPEGLAGECPWPPVGELIAMLGALPGDVQDDLQASLSLAAGRTPKPDAGTHPTAQLIDMLDSLPEGSAGRVLIAGHANAALIGAAARVGGGYVTLAAADAAGAGALRPLVAEAEAAVAVLRLDEEAQAGQLFDLILGAGVSNGPLAPRQLARFVAPGGSVLFAEETPDLFALLSGRHTDGEAIERLQAAFAATGVSLAARPSHKSEAVTLLQGARTGEAQDLALPEGDLAAVLAAMPDAPLFRLVPDAPAGETASARAIRHAAAFRDLPETDGPLWIVALSAEDSAALFALRRVVANESGRDLRVLALTPAAPATTGDLARRIARLTQAPEREIVADDRQGTPAASPRIVAVAPPQPPVAPGEDTLLRLSARRRTPVLDGLYWQRLPRPEPAPGEVEIAVEASALNFRDVMWGQGLIPPEALEGGFAGQGFGMECAGRVLRCGADVPPYLAPGTPVIAFAPHAFGSHVTVPAHAVMPRDRDMPAEIATAAPVVFLTADYALNELARLTTGETILIHGAAGGVGIAAIQIAQRVGARIIATAGSVEKRLWLGMIGVDTVLDSRAGDFADRVMAETGGHGVDVVLNALAGEGLERGLSCLAPFGRFVELGKRDIYENNLIALRAFRNNISLLAVDADQLLAYRPKVAARIMDRVGRGLAEGTLTPPPVRVMAAEEVTDAFRLMQRSGHIGKIVVRAPHPAGRAPARRTDLSGNWLITGGTGGFGYRTALWLKQQGAERIWLTSRSGRHEGALPEGFTLRAADATDAVAMQAVLDEIAAAGGLSGFIHSAAVLDDALFATLDPARIGRVAGAKAGGAELLDRLTRDLPLRHFWCFSSVAARFGNPGQAAYAAANAETEALMRRRRDAGLPGLAIAWGPISDTGMLARDAALRATLTAQLGRLLTAEEALQTLAAWLADAPAQAATVTIAPIRWGRLAGDLPVLSGPLFAAIDTETARAAGSVDLAALVAVGKEGEARRIALEAVLTEAAQIMRTTPAAIDPQRPLTDLGLDSLMAMNLKLAIEERFGVDIPARALAGEPSPARLVQSLFDTISGGSAGAQGAVLVEAHLSETVLTDDVRAEIMERTRAPSAGMEARRN
ncbi:acyltransferase domain-containing protein [Sinirhodobacter populi]|uniref:Acyltransferase domain-containing protein n=1 Tax=Paenirhodobacter populi TaxID=2306993 RepID=A0A443K2M2_9RHOB|nr:type I polyketide synthase [Sinirhodobacter populi]RWR27021.1 acyltransferase domain-containing protein [Sinirhodobacter populi]